MQISDFVTFRYCPNCGCQNMLPKDTKACQCAGCGFLYFHNPAAGVCAMIEQQGRVLLTVRAREPQKGLLSLPGGFADYQESLEETLAREIREELNVQIECSKYLCSAHWQYLYHGVLYPTLIAYFAVTVKDIAPLKAGDDAAGIVWLPLNELDTDRLAFGCDRFALQTYRASPKVTQLY